MASLLNWATGIAILISCLGLFGLATYTAVQRTKEIGIRKVLGASLGDLLLLMSRDYVKLIVLSLCIVISLANYFMQEWLAGFNWRVGMQWWMIGLPGLLVLCIAFLSVVSQTLKNARKNPVDSLRYE